jgi:ceramide glucosyltransferase
MRSYKQAKHDILWVLDSNVQVAPGTLARSVDALEHPEKEGGRRIGVVHHVPFAFLSEPMLGSRVEAAFLNTNHAKMYLAINTVAIDSCVMGKSCLYRRSDLERLTGDLRPALLPLSPDPLLDASEESQTSRGLAAFGRFLAEDNMIAGAIWHELGLRHSLGCDISRNIVGRMTFRDYVARRIRWIRVRKRMVLAATLLEPLTECVALSLVGSWAVYRLWSIPTFITFTLHYCSWVALDLDVYESLAGYYLPEGQRMSFLLAWLIRELLAFPIWLIAFVGNEVEWRGRKYKMLRNGEVARASVSNRSWIRSFFDSGKERMSYEQLDQEALPIQ